MAPPTIRAGISFYKFMTHPSKRWSLAPLLKIDTPLENLNIPSAERTEWVTADSNDAGYHKFTEEKIVVLAQAEDNVIVTKRRITFLPLLFPMPRHALP